MKLTLNGETRQQASTSQMVFPVAAIIAFIASFVTLEPGTSSLRERPPGWDTAPTRFSNRGMCSRRALRALAH